MAIDSEFRWNIDSKFRLHSCSASSFIGSAVVGQVRVVSSWANAAGQIAVIFANLLFFFGFFWRV